SARARRRQRLCSGAESLVFAFCLLTFRRQQDGIPPQFCLACGYRLERMKLLPRSAEIAGKLTASRLTPISCGNCERVASLTGAAPRCGWWQACRDELYGSRRQASSFHHIRADVPARALQAAGASRSEEHTSELQSR